MSDELQLKKINIDDLVEIELKEKDDFLKVRETLERVGVASNREKKLFPSCHILHKQGHYYIVHFKEMFMLDGKPANFSEEDVGRRNKIANLLVQWNLVTLTNPEKTKEPEAPMNKIKVIVYSDKKNWTICPKYNIGTKKKFGEVTEIA